MNDDEDDEEEYDEEDEEEGLDARVNGSVESGGDAEEDGEGDGVDNEEDEDGSDDENMVEDDEDEDDEDEAESEDDEEDEDEDEEERSEGGTAEGQPADGDVEMANGEDEAGSSHPSQPSRAKSRSPVPLHLVRRSLFIPAYATIPTSLSIEAVVAIPLPSAVHSIASTTCSSYHLIGSQEGYVRCYDFWSSVNGGQVMTAQQRTVVGLGESLSKAGVGKGWWGNEVEGAREGVVAKRLEPVYSLACEGDGLWALTGTQSGAINLYTLRHSPGHLIHSLKGHTSVVSCLSLLPNEKGFISGSWDGTLREWDLNTGQTIRTYPSHGAQLSSLALRPYSHPPSPSPSPNVDEQEDREAEGRGETPENVSITMGAGFFEKREVSEPLPADAPEADAVGDRVTLNGSPAGDTIADVTMSDEASPYDPLFDDDAEGEEVPPSTAITVGNTPTINDLSLPSPAKSRPPALALPGAPRQSSVPTSASTPLFPAAQLASTSRQGAASNIPLLSPTTYKAFSEDVLLTSSMDGQVVLIDRRVPVYDRASGGVGRLLAGDKAPPWCMSACWSGNGNQVLAGRRNGTVDIWDVRRSSTATSPNLVRTLRTPAESGPVSCVVALPDGRHVATASQDNIRLWNTAEYFEPDDSVRRSKSRPPFKIIAGHHGGIVSAMVVDPTSRFLITASGDRGWQGESTRVVLIHEIKW